MNIQTRRRASWVGFLRPCFGQFHPDLSGIFAILFAPGAFGVGHYSRWAIIRRWGINLSKSVKMEHYLRWAIIRDWGIIQVNTVVDPLMKTSA